MKKNQVAFSAAAAISLAIIACPSPGGGSGPGGETSGGGSSEKAITSFVFKAADNPGLSADVTGTIVGTTVSVAVDSFYPLDNLVPTIAVSPRASLAPASGAALNFTNGGMYVVTAEDLTLVPYSVTVSNAAASLLAGDVLTGGHADGTGAASSFSIPNGIVADSTNVYVADTYNHTIRKVVISSGVVTTLAGLAGTPGVADLMSVNGVNARFNAPRGITVNGQMLYIADTTNNNIRKVDTSTSNNVVSSLGVTANYHFPQGITTDGTYLYIADTSQNRMLKQLIGDVNVDSLGTTSWSGPIGVVTDGTNIYVADTGNHVIRQIVIASGATTVLAGQVGMSGKADGVGTAASFSHPSGVTKMGNRLFIADTDNDVIRCLNLGTNAVSTVVPGTPMWQPLTITTDGTHLFATSGNAIFKIE